MADKFVGRFFKFYCNSADCLPHDVGSGCGESQNRLLTDLCPLFFFVHWFFTFM